MMKCNNVLRILISIATFITLIARNWNVDILKDSTQFFYICCFVLTQYLYITM